MDKPAERRRFTRIPFDAECEMRTAAGTGAILQLADISLHGALAESQAPLPLAAGETAELQIYLTSDILIRMPVTLAHTEPPRYGFLAGDMDLDSVSHLRRLVELNLGDETLLERELDQLVSGAC
ncbi:cyclic diguanosine monophosphate-binding protein [Marinobacterium nitratireducens]|uniref:Cyclic diguanosine monophosphate-binding protein n=1 Tax=Marinobacterium nitratireducens TaxID=518897 RepID=A0A917Z9D8_9GAMM|nr:PilZ domain-containing protein [Marinobacterium nitratireducens]GGO78362.1 cyclic diguanosine monophosphate-binding protein [Marinobacterium nitratireducens]